jgi:uncharacterized SAM-binding protein YcdF (DUF218 family)
MFFILSKLLAYALVPLIIVCFLLVVSALLKNASWKKRFFYCGLGILLFCSNDFIANEVALLWEIPVTRFADVGNYEWGLLLTGVTKYEVGPNDRVYFSRGADRVTHTVQLYKMGKIKKILVTGGSGRLDAMEMKESGQIASALRLMGVPDSVIVEESISRNTHESAVESKKIIDQKKLNSKFLLVTSAFHMRRSLLCFRKVGLDVDPFSVDFITHKRKFNPDVLFIPKIEAMLSWQILIKEWTGIVAYKMAGYI